MNRYLYTIEINEIDSRKLNEPPWCDKADIEVSHDRAGQSVGKNNDSTAELNNTIWTVL